MTSRRTRGRPPFVFPPGAEANVATAAYNGASDRVLAGIFGCSVDTIIRHFGPIVRKQRALRQLAIASAQQKHALKGNPALLIWLGKQPVEKGGLGQRDEVTLGNVDLAKLTDEELETIAAGKAKPRLKVEDGGKAPIVSEKKVG